MKALITRKVGMTSVIDDNGVVTAVTLLSASPCVVTQVKTTDIDGYQAVQMGFEQSKNISKAQKGHFLKSKSMPKIVKEFRIDELGELKVGDNLNVDGFSIGELVDATGKSKGKGFAGTIKRHNFKRGRKTHGGQSYRRPGSIGSMYPQHILPGKKMAGHMGDERVTVKNLRVALVDLQLGIIGLAGAVPGPRRGIVTIKGVK